MIPLVRPLVPPVEEWQDLLAECHRTGRFTNFGPCFDEASRVLEEASGRPCVPVSSGTSALELAIRTAFKPGSTIAVPDFTFAATLQAVFRAGMKALIFPCRKDTWTLSMESVEKNSGLIDGMIVTSPFGYRVDFDRYNAWSKNLGLRLVYDLAGSWSIPFSGGAPAAFSFHATKNMGIGEGGCVSVKTAAQVDAVKRMSNFGFDDQRVPGDNFSGNSKLDEIHCAMIIAHLRDPGRIQKRVDRKKAVISRYRNDLQGMIEWHDLEVGGAPYTAAFCFKKDPTGLVEAAAADGIEMRRAYYPLLSDLYPNIQASSQPLHRCIALPSDVDDNEYSRVVRFLKSRP